MGKFYDFLKDSSRMEQSGAVLRVTGDRNIPLMAALLDLYVAQPETLQGLIEVIPSDGEQLWCSI